MNTLLKNGKVINVFTGTIEKKDILIENNRIVEVREEIEGAADLVENVENQWICPGLIDGHIHLESTMLMPFELSKICLPHGTTSVVADPHEIANVCGTEGIDFMMEASGGLPLHTYFMLPSCVPATPYDENGARLSARELKPYYEYENVLGLAEVMDYYGVLEKREDIMKKIRDARTYHKKIDGHAPLLSGKELDAYIAAGIGTDHECSNVDEAVEKLKKGQWIMIREGSSARNLNQLMPLFDEPFCHRCLLVTDDRHPSDIIREGHIDHMIRKAVKDGKSVVTAIQMATIQAAQCFGISDVGAIALGYRADLLIIDDLEKFQIRHVYADGKKVVENKEILDYPKPEISKDRMERMKNSFHLLPVKKEDFYLEPQNPCRVIGLLEGNLITEERIIEINWNEQNGIDTNEDILKLAVLERHQNTNHKGIGLIHGIGLKKGAIASSVSHDSHNLIVIGAKEEDMAVAANRIIELGGGYVIVSEGKVLCELPLPVAGLISDRSAGEIIEMETKMRKMLKSLGIREKKDPFMDMAFLSLPVIPHLKMTTRGLFDVEQQKFRTLGIERGNQQE